MIKIILIMIMAFGTLMLVTTFQAYRMEKVVVDRVLDKITQAPKTVVSQGETCIPAKKVCGEEGCWYEPLDHIRFGIIERPVGAR